MTKLPTTRTPAWPDTRFKVPPDLYMYVGLHNDMLAVWGSADNGIWTKVDTIMVGKNADNMLEYWCGEVGSIELANPGALVQLGMHISSFDEYFWAAKELDHLGIIRDRDLVDLARRNWHLFDLRSVIDVSYIRAFADLRDGDVVMEVGGGFGRLAEMLALTTPERIKYVNIDASPASLMYSYQYLSEMFPDRKVQLFDVDAPWNDDFDFLIVPAWRLSQLPHFEVSCAINVESFQEMNQSVVDEYLEFFERRLRVGGLVYSANSREWLFQGDWNYPQTWECLYQRRTPQAWTLNHPTSIFRKQLGDRSASRVVQEAGFRHEVDSTRTVIRRRSAGAPHPVAVGVLPLDGRDPAVLETILDAEWYFNRYVDVPDCGMDPLGHFLRVGITQGRDPNAFFDTTWYYEQYPDIERRRMIPLLHYLEDGAWEGRDPGPDFSTIQYLIDNQDAQAARANPLMHHMSAIKAQRQRPSIDELSRRAGDAPRPAPARPASLLNPDAHQKSVGPASQNMNQLTYGRTTLARP